MSSATERLRELLDERGMEYAWEHVEDGTLFHIVNDGKTYFILMRGGSGLEMWSQHLTPEQAIDATLGAGTCHAVISDNLTESEGTGDAWADCSECGHLLYVLTDPNSKPPRFCPNCGRKVVDE